MHRDHVVPAYTPRTLATILERNGWQAQILFCNSGPDPTAGGAKARASARSALGRGAIASSVLVRRARRNSVAVDVLAMLRVSGHLGRRPGCFAPP